MNKQQVKQTQQKRRAHRTRARMTGTAQRPRLSVHRSLQHISAQLIDDISGKTLAYADDRALKGKKTDRAMEVGKLIADKAKQQGISSVVFDRGAFRYHGRVKAVAEGARSTGLQF